MYAEKKVYVLDGGFGSQIGLNVDESIDADPLWSARFLISEPKAVVQTHLDFLRAGADIITTNTYQASIDGFTTHLNISKEESYKLIKTAVQLANQAKKKYQEEAADETHAREILIAGSCGPYGAALHDCSEYDGSYADKISKSEMIEWHRPRVQALVEAGVDLLAFETIPAQSEGEAVMELLKEFPNMRAWLSFSCKDNHHLCHGEEFKSAAIKCWQLNSMQLVAIGTNCVNPQFVSTLLRDVNDARKDDHFLSTPFIVYPNKGQIYSIDKGWHEHGTRQPVAHYVEEWLNLGAMYIGGCCQNYASDIAQIYDRIKSVYGKK